ncbi:MAG: hypothetical protein L0Z51_02305 [Candidatus Latescibacteria bacterium]|nr:hypothetical protein [Candidatus Latescibacterota bacterium]
MTRRHVAWTAALVWVTAAPQVAAQEFAVGIIDFYGLGRVSAAIARRALTFAEGDTVSLAGDERPAFLAESERRLAALPGVLRARTNIVCCNDGRLIIYVGLEHGE